MKTLHYTWGLMPSVLLPLSAAPGDPGVVVSVVHDPEPGAPARHGIAAVLDALRARGVACEEVTALNAARGRLLVVAGIPAPGGPAAQVLAAWGLPAPVEPEALVVRRGEWGGRPAVLLAGTDDRGLMYAALDVAERIGWAADPADPFRQVADAAEKPAVRERALSIYTMHRASFERRFYDAAYWARYLDLLARNRFNSLVLIFGYENGGFLAPPYPYFFNVEGFADVRMVGITPAEQARNLDALNQLIHMAHQRGLGFTVGIWDHIYRGGVQGGGVVGADAGARAPTPGLAWGVTERNLVAYTTAALAEFLRRVPEVDALQFRMHDESGLKKEEQEGFWREVFRVVKEHRPGLRFDARAKGLPDSVIETGLAMGVNLRVCTKYWMEQMGMPFHPTHINRQNQFDRRHSYADLLRYPRRYSMMWRLWNGGTSRVLLWGDPDYARRFAESTHLYDGDGFEVNEPLATKMEAQPHDAETFDLLNPAYRSYDWEFERYWHFFQVFGRLGYNPETPPQVWRREFEKRFGAAAPYVERALHRASRILPRIVGACYPYRAFPMTRGWAEKQRLGDLPAYAGAEGSDTEQFAGFEEEARNRLAGRDTAKRRPPETSRWLAETAAAVLADLTEAERRIGPDPGPEFRATAVDLRILANLALYHSRRIFAAVGFSLFRQTQDVNPLDDAIAHEREAVDAWRSLVAAAGDAYADDLAMGARTAGLCGHWRDEMAALEKGLSDLEQQRDDFQAAPTGVQPTIAHVPARRVLPGEPIPLRVTIAGPRPIATARVVYRIGDREDRFVPLEPAGGPRYRATLPALPEGGRLSYYLEAADEAGERAVWPAGGAEEAITIAATSDVDAPDVTHAPVTAARPGESLRIAARVSDASGVRWARLRYRNVNQQRDYATLEMLPTGTAGEYAAVIPAADVAPEWDLMYFIEAMDRHGNGRIHPDLEQETPYAVVALERPK